MDGSHLMVQIIENMSMSNQTPPSEGLIESHYLRDHRLHSLQINSVWHRNDHVCTVQAKIKSIRHQRSGLFYFHRGGLNKPTLPFYSLISFLGYRAFLAIPK